MLSSSCALTLRVTPRMAGAMATTSIICTACRGQIADQRHAATRTRRAIRVQNTSVRYRRIEKLQLVERHPKERRRPVTPAHRRYRQWIKDLQAEVAGAPGFSGKSAACRHAHGR